MDKKWFLGQDGEPFAVTHQYYAEKARELLKPKFKQWLIDKGVLEYYLLLLGKCYEEWYWEDNAIEVVNDFRSVEEDFGYLHYEYWRDIGRYKQIVDYDKYTLTKGGGMFWEWFPELSGDYDKDIEIIKSKID